MNLQKDWQYLQTIDHIHLMDDQHPGYHENSNLYCIYKSKYDAFINYMNILDDFRLKIKEAAKKSEKNKSEVVNKIKTGYNLHQFISQVTYTVKGKNQLIFLHK